MPSYRGEIRQCAELIRSDGMELLPENGSPVTSNTEDYKSQQYVMVIGLKGLIDRERKPSAECSGLEAPDLRLLPEGDVSFSPSVLGRTIKYFQVEPH